MGKMITDYELDEQNRVKELNWMDDSQTCTAVLNDDGKTYTYSSNLEGDETVIEAPEAMSLADCVLAANVHLGVIPSQNFDPIECNNQH